MAASSPRPLEDVSVGHPVRRQPHQAVPDLRVRGRAGHDAVPHQPAAVQVAELQVDAEPRRQVLGDAQQHLPVPGDEVHPAQAERRRPSEHPGDVGHEHGRHDSGRDVHESLLPRPAGLHVQPGQTRRPGHGGRQPVGRAPVLLQRLLVPVGVARGQEHAPGAGGGGSLHVGATVVAVVEDRAGRHALRLGDHVVQRSPALGRAVAVGDVEDVAGGEEPVPLELGLDEVGRQVHVAHVDHRPRAGAVLPHQPGPGRDHLEQLRLDVHLQLPEALAVLRWQAERGGELGVDALERGLGAVPVQGTALRPRPGPGEGLRRAGDEALLDGSPPDQVEHGLRRAHRSHEDGLEDVERHEPVRPGCGRASRATLLQAPRAAARHPGVHDPILADERCAGHRGAGAAAQPWRLRASPTARSVSLRSCRSRSVCRLS